MLLKQADPWIAEIEGWGFNTFFFSEDTLQSEQDKRKIQKH